MFKFRSPEERKFLTILVATSWLCNASFGIHMSVLGPAQPYLAKGPFIYDVRKNFGILDPLSPLVHIWDTAEFDGVKNLNKNVTRSR